MDLLTQHRESIATMGVVIFFFTMASLPAIVFKISRRYVRNAKRFEKAMDKFEEINQYYEK